MEDEWARSVDGLGLHREGLLGREGVDPQRAARAVTFWVTTRQPAIGRIGRNGLALVVLLLLLGRATGGVGRARTRLACKQPALGRSLTPCSIISVLTQWGATLVLLIKMRERERERERARERETSTPSHRQNIARTSRSRLKNTLLSVKKFSSIILVTSFYVRAHTERERYH